MSFIKKIKKKGKTHAIEVEGYRDMEGKISPYLVIWNQLSDEIKEYDRIFIKKLPAFLYESGFQIYRL